MKEHDQEDDETEEPQVSKRHKKGDEDEYNDQYMKQRRKELEK